MKYKLQMLPNCGPRDGFYIVKPDKKMILDVNPVTIVKELNKLLRDIKSLEVVRDRLLENALIVKEAGNKNR
jgi:hypothetical protein